MGAVRRPQLAFYQDSMKETHMNGMKDSNVSGLESGSESESEPEEIEVSEPSKRAIYNREGLLEKLDDISWPDNVDWIHKLTVDHNQEQEIDVNDDIVRELAFYTQALEGTREAYAKLHPMGIPFFRPHDYYAEMVKSDSHMLKIKGKLLVEKQKLEEAEERKKARESKKIAKEVQAQKLKERAKMKKEGIESVKKWRKQRQQSGFAGGKDAQLDLNFDEDKGFQKGKKKRPGVAPGDRSGGGRGGKFGGDRGGKFSGGKGKNLKRERRDAKFGSGGRKGMKKQNTANTTNDLRGFNGGDSRANKRSRR